MELKALENPGLIAKTLKRHPIENAYMLGYLDEEYVDECKWYVAIDEDDNIGTLVLLYDGLSMPAIFVSGDQAHASAILQKFDVELPEETFARISRGLGDAVSTRYDGTENLREMSRMGLSRSEFLAGDDGEEEPDVVALSHRDTGSIMATYAVWPDHFFDPYQLGSGLYFGIRADDGRIASIAGIHTISAEYDVAAIGNLVTHPDFRGNGYARRVTRVLLRELFERVGLVTLDVQKGNAPAIRTYKHFGFQHYAEFSEGLLMRRGV